MGTKGTRLPIELEIEPREGNRVLYLRVAPPTLGGKPRAMIFFTLKAMNNTDQPLAVEELTVTFPGTSLKFEFPSREVVIPPHKAKNVGLKDGDENKGTYAEEIELDEFPTKIKITLAVPALPGGIVWRTWDLGPHATSYDFFARPEKGDYGEYIQLQYVHVQGGGVQHFGQDANVLGWNHDSGKLAKYKTDNATNEDRFAYERPLYAMADGLVVRAVRRHPDNPSPSRRMFNAKNQGTEYKTPVQVEGISVTTLSASKMLLAVITDAGRLELRCLRQDPAGEVLTVLGFLHGPPGEGVSATALDETRALTAVQNGQQCELILWNIFSDGATISKADKVTMHGVLEVKVIKALVDGSTTFVVTAARTVPGALALGVWRIVGDTFRDQKPHATAIASLLGPFDVMGLDTPGRLATAARTGDGRLEVIVWDLESAGGDGWGGSEGEDDFVLNGVMTKRDEALTIETVEEVSLAATGKDDRIATAVRTQNDNLKLIVWQVDPAGNVTRGASIEEPGDASLIHLSFFKTKSVLAAYRTGAGKLRVISWAVGDNTIAENYAHDRGPTDLIAMTRVPTAQDTVVTAVRTGGIAKVILWQFSDNNAISILHGDELVHFFHLREGSIPDHLLLGVDDAGWAKAPYRPVARGQRIGMIGHSGKSAGPHVHIHCVKVRPELVQDMDKLVAELKAGGDGGVFRPLQFHGVLAMRQDNVKPGWMNNPMSEMKGEGGYFDKYVVWPWDGEPPACAGLRTERAALQGEIDAWSSEIDDLQRELSGSGSEEFPGPSFKEQLRERVRRLEAKIGAHQSKLDTLRKQATRLGCMP